MSDAQPLGDTTIEPGELRPTDPTTVSPAPDASPRTVSGTPAPRSAPAFGTGTQLGAFRILAHIGRGGMGDVYRAVDVSLEREVAIKTIVKSLGADESFVLRFKEEAKSAARLSHPHLVQVHAFGEHEGTLYFAMELVTGRSLGERLRDGPIPWRDAARFAAQAARGLEAAAAQGIIHRDVKPENLLVAKDETVKVADFGLAKRLQGDATHTASGVIVGTPRYMSPEQAQGETIDFRSDIYSLGATLFHLVAGRPVFDGDSAMRVCMKHIQDTPPLLATVAPGVPEALSRTVARMLSKRREDRHPSYSVLVTELESIATGSGSAVTVIAPVAAAPATTPTSSPAPTPAPFGANRPFVQVVKRPDGGFEVGLNCPMEKPLDEGVRKARAGAPLASSVRRLAADTIDLGYILGALALLGLLPLPYPPYPQAIIGLAGSLAAVQYLTRNGGTLGERLLEVRLVSRTGALPSVRSVGMGWLLEKGFPAIIFICIVAFADLRKNIPEYRIILCAAGLACFVAVEQTLAFCTGRSLRDRIYGTKVVDVRGLPDDDLGE